MLRVPHPRRFEPEESTWPLNHPRRGLLRAFLRRRRKTRSPRRVRSPGSLTPCAGSFGSPRTAGGFLSWSIGPLIPSSYEHELDAGALSDDDRHRVGLDVLASPRRHRRVGHCECPMDCQPPGHGISLRRTLIAGGALDARPHVDGADSVDRGTRQYIPLWAWPRAPFASGTCEMSASVVSRSDATDAAFCSALRTTFAGSITPAATRSS